MRFLRDGGVSSVLESSCILLYTAVLRAALSCPHEKITIFQPTLGPIFNSLPNCSFYSELSP